MSQKKLKLAKFKKESAIKVPLIVSVEETAQKMMFSIRIFSVNVTKSAVSCGFGHIY